MKSRKVTPYSCEENSGLMHRTRDERKWVISLKDAKLSHDGVEGNKNARVVGRTLLFQSQDWDSMARRFYAPFVDFTRLS